MKYLKQLFSLNINQWLKKIKWKITSTLVGGDTDQSKIFILRNKRLQYMLGQIKSNW